MKLKDCKTLTQAVRTFPQSKELLEHLQDKGLAIIDSSLDTFFDNERAPGDGLKTMRELKDLQSAFHHIGKDIKKARRANLEKLDGHLYITDDHKVSRASIIRDGGIEKFTRDRPKRSRSIVRRRLCPGQA